MYSLQEDCPVLAPDACLPLGHVIRVIPGRPSGIIGGRSLNFSSLVILGKANTK